jgi:hypothetical protein
MYIFSTVNTYQSQLTGATFEKCTLSPLPHCIHPAAPFFLLGTPLFQPPPHHHMCHRIT